MNDIVIINGSPKTKDSVSGMLIGKIEEITGNKIPVYQATQFIKMENAASALADILSARTLLIVFPLYVDGLPAPLVKALGMIEQATGNAEGRLEHDPLSTTNTQRIGQAAGTEGRLPRVYAICNCGFFEAEHTRLALDMVKSFSACAGMGWGYGVGVGGGGFIGAQSKSMAKGGPAAAVYAALRELCKAMQDESAGSQTAHQNVFATPKVPRSLYLILANMEWRRTAKKYGAAKSLNARPHSPSHS